MNRYNDLIVSTLMTAAESVVTAEAGMNDIHEFNAFMKKYDKAFLEKLAGKLGVDTEKATVLRYLPLHTLSMNDLVSMMISTSSECGGSTDQLAESDLIKEYSAIESSQINAWAEAMEHLSIKLVKVWFRTDAKGYITLELNDGDMTLYLLQPEGKEHYSMLVDHGTYADIDYSLTGGNPAHAASEEWNALADFMLGYSVNDDPNAYQADGRNVKVSLGEGKPSIAIACHAYPRGVRTAAAAISGLGKAITTARKNFLKEVDFEMLKNEAVKGDAADVRYSPDPAIQTLQEDLLGKLRDFPGEDAEVNRAECKELLDQLVQAEFGNCDIDEGRPYSIDDPSMRFNASLVRDWMDSSDTPMDRQEKLVSWLRFLHADADAITVDTADVHLINQRLDEKTDRFLNTMKNRLIYFNEEKKVKVLSTFQKSVLKAVKETVESSGCVLKSTEIDDRGIIRYTAERGNGKTVTGEIGQVFNKDDNGAVRTRFGGVNKHLLVPGYNALILPPEDENDKGTLGERTRLIGYEHNIIASLRRQIRTDLFDGQENVGSVVSLNHVYKEEDVVSRHPAGFLTDSIENGMSKELRAAILKTESGRVRYSNYYRDYATISNCWEFSEKKDSATAAMQIAGKTESPVDETEEYYDMAIMYPDTYRYFDKTATGSGKNQGVIRHLVEGAAVDPETGKITPSNVEGDRCPLLKLPYLRYIDHSPFDRQQMVFSNLRMCSRVSEPAWTAQMTFGGWNFDDGFVVSKEFARKYKANHEIKLKDGTYRNELRDLTIGDKICDFGGNKGVISLIVDRSMSDETADMYDPSGNLKQAVQWFRANPKLEVVEAPYSAASRYNAATELELEEHAETLMSPDGTEHPFAMGQACYIITDKTAAEKTTIYAKVKEEDKNKEKKRAEEDSEADEIVDLVDFSMLTGDEADAPGVEDGEDSEIGLDEEYNAHNPGRRISGQLAWAFNSFNAKEVMRHFYGRNDSGVRELREYLIANGFDLSENGTFRVGYHKHKNEDRIFVKLPTMAELQKLYPDAEGKKTKKYGTKLKEYYRHEIAMHGGFLEVPFALKYICGGEPKPSFEEFRTVSRTEGFLDANGGKDAHSYAMPVLPVMLRRTALSTSGSEAVSEYTRYYQQVIDQTAVWMDAWMDLQSGNMSASVKAEAAMKKAAGAAQRAYDRLIDRIVSDRFTGKYNVFRTSIMTRPVNSSATAIWTADPTLNLDEVMISEKIWERLALRDGDYVMIWRDPVMRDEGVRYLKAVKAVDNRIGISINPVIDKSFDGDFDGDTVAVVKIGQDKMADTEAKSLMSLEANLIDKGSGADKDGMFNLMLNTGLDFKTVYAGSDKNGLTEIRTEANAVLNAYIANVDDIKRRDNGTDVTEEKLEAAHQDYVERNKKIVNELNQYVHDTFNQDYGLSIMIFRPLEYMKGLWQMSKSKDGAKGKMSDINKYLVPLLGYQYESAAAEAASENGDFSGLKNVPFESLSGLIEQRMYETEYSTAVKSFATGTAGAFSQRGVRAMRNICPMEITQLTYPVTQAILQSKHNAQDSKKRFAYLQQGGECERLWQGLRPVQADEEDAPLSKDKWVDEFYSFYKESMGVDINKDFVAAVAEKLADNNDRMRGITSKEIMKTMASTMDELAYFNNKRSSLSAIRNMAELNEKTLASNHSNFDDEKLYNLFKGRSNAQFMPDCVAKEEGFWYNEKN